MILWDVFVTNTRFVHEVRSNFSWFRQIGFFLIIESGLLFGLKSFFFLIKDILRRNHFVRFTSEDLLAKSIFFALQFARAAWRLVSSTSSSQEPEASDGVAETEPTTRSCLLNRSTPTPESVYKALRLRFGVSGVSPSRPRRFIRGGGTAGAGPQWMPTISYQSQKNIYRTLFFSPRKCQDFVFFLYKTNWDKLFVENRQKQLTEDPNGTPPLCRGGAGPKPPQKLFLFSSTNKVEETRKRDRNEGFRPWRAQAVTGWVSGHSSPLHSPRFIPVLY